MIRKVLRPACLCAVVAAMLLPATGAAHEIRPGAMEIIERADHSVEVMWRQPVAGDYATPLTPHLSSGWLDQVPTAQSLTRQSLTRIWRVANPGTALAGQTLRIQGLDQTLTDVFLRVRWANGDETTSLLKPRQPGILLSPRAGQGLAVPAYLRLGVIHIWTGYDHLLYLLGLLLLITDWRSLITVISAFTLAHSLTLALSVLGVIVLRPAPVEAVIALSVLFVATELLRKRRGEPSLTQRKPWLVALLFGLLHGFGFAGALRQTGLPQDSVAAPLLLFNLGIEAGQLVFVGLVLAVLWLARRWLPAAETGLRASLPHAIGGLAAYWLIGRMVELV